MSHETFESLLIEKSI